MQQYFPSLESKKLYLCFITSGNIFLTSQGGESQLGLSVHLIISFIKISPMDLQHLCSHSHSPGHSTVLVEGQ
jgi:hypothetical protein